MTLSLQNLQRAFPGETPPVPAAEQRIALCLFNLIHCYLLNDNAVPMASLLRVCVVPMQETATPAQTFSQDQMGSAKIPILLCGLCQQCSPSQPIIPRIHHNCWPIFSQ